jgi:CheY-like chemotaxis protein
MADESANVLLVEDHPHTQFLVQKLLDDHCACEVADDAQQAFQFAEERVYDLVLLDIDLGGGPNGVDVLEKLRGMESWSDVPIIALTAYAFPEDRERFLESGFDAYLSKPFTKEELRGTVDDTLDA